MARNRPQPRRRQDVATKPKPKAQTKAKKPATVKRPAGNKNGKK
jgi:hypothetical protein